MSKIFLVVRDSRYFLSHRLSLALALKERGHALHIYCAVRDDQDSKALAKHGLLVTHIPLLGEGFVGKRALESLKVLYEGMRRERPDTIFAVTVLANLLTGILCRWFKVRHIVLVAGVGTLYRTEGLRYRLLRIVSNALYRFALKKPQTKVIFQNANDRSIFLENGLCREADTLLIPGSGVDLTAFPYRPYELSPQRARRVGMVARMLRDKGVVEFVEAAKHLKRKHQEVEFVLVGGVDKANPTSLSPEELEGLLHTEDVQWLNHRSDIPEILAGFDIFCLPSYHEGLPKAMLEAAAAGCSLVVTDIPGCRAFVENDVNGMLVPVKDASALASAIEELLEKPEMAARLAKAAYGKVESGFSQEKVLGLYLGVFEG